MDNIMTFRNYFELFGTSIPSNFFGIKKHERYIVNV